MRFLLQASKTVSYSIFSHLVDIPLYKDGVEHVFFGGENIHTFERLRMDDNSFGENVTFLTLTNGNIFTK